MTKKNIKISAEFKAQTTKAIVSILLFFITYIVMLVLSIKLTIWCIYAGISLIITKPMFFTLIAGIGIASLGILVVFFLIKFIFKSGKVDLSHLTEIKRSDEPELFKLIDEIVKEVGTKSPKRVYLSTDVNASVFYDSTFWSMFFPVKKNLQIGLGLVNTVTQSELKAILSHEFGHFSQKTMKVGSYVYNVNKVIFNLLYDNESYDQMAQKWSNSSGYFILFVLLTLKIIDGIKWILQQMYTIVNRSYMALSREMEFHADEIAANITGYDPLKSSLLRMSLAEYSYNSVLSFYDGQIINNKKSENIFKDQLFAFHYFAQENKLEIKNNLPQITDNVLNKFNKSRLVIKDQWASHPSVEDRIARLEKTGLISENIDNRTANSLFSNIEKTHLEFTQKLFQKVVYTSEASTLSFEDFQEKFNKDMVDNSFPKLYNGYYNNKNPMFFDVETINNSTQEIKLENLFSDEMINLVYTTISIQNDLDSIKQIANKTWNIKTFDYDGIKYKRKNSQELIKKLESELESFNQQILQNDIRIFQFFSNCESQIKYPSLLAGYYKIFFKYDKIYDRKYDIYIQLLNQLQFINVVTPYEQITANFKRIESYEEDLKRNIKEFLDSSDYESEISKEMRENFEQYLSRYLAYFDENQYNDHNLHILFTALNDYAFLLSRGYFLIKKMLLNYQLEVFKTAHPEIQIPTI